jgi:prevent-host-death family protein
VLETFTVQEAPARFEELLLKVREGPVRITQSGKPVSVIMSSDDYEIIETMKMLYLKEKLARSDNDVANGRVADGPAFFDDLLAGKYD